MDFFRDFFLIAFGFGFVMTLISFIASGLHFASGLDGPHLGHGHLHLPHHAHAGHAHAGHADAGHGSGETASAITMPSILAFLMGMGGVGYLTLTSLGWPWPLALASGTVVGLALGWLITAVLRALYRGQTIIQPGSDSLEGRPGTLTSQIRPGGTGELVYVLHGVRQSIPARSADGHALPKGTPVAVVRVERGIAYVLPLAESPLRSHTEQEGPN